MKNKIIIAFVTLLSLILIPNKVHAASYEDYFTINKYFYSQDVVSYVIRIKPTDKLVALEDVKVTDDYKEINGIKGVDGEYQILLTDGSTISEKVKFADAKINENNETVNYLEGYIDVTAIEETKASMIDKVSKIIFNFNTDDYKSKLVIDVAKIEVDEQNNVTNADKIVTEEALKTETKVEDKVETINSETSSVSKEALNEIKTAGNKVTYEAKDNNKLMYAWTFDGSKMTSSHDYNIDLNLTVNAKDELGISKIIPKTVEKPVILNFKHHGLLPTGTSLRVNVSEYYKDGDKVTLYYYNEETKKLEEVKTNMTVKNGIVDFNLEHCSYYVLARSNTAPNNSQTSSINVVLYISLAFASLIGIAYITLKSNKKIV